ncbi:MAG: hypothetical protein LBT43_05030 [Prevotella sp.]|jgi:hypothetical protein|nr:hypothetical protein [Prevotella sp.]
METKKVIVITEIEIEYNPDLTSIDNILSEMDYSFKAAEMHADVANVKDTEIIEWR